LFYGNKTLLLKTATHRNWSTARPPPEPAVLRHSASIAAFYEAARRRRTQSEAFLVSFRDSKLRRNRSLCPHAEKRSTCRPCATARMARWRRENSEAARAAEDRRTDERRAAERRARSYVSAYLRRGRIVPSPICDRCGQRKALTFYHPDPLDRRRVLWLCAADRRAVAAGGFAVVPHWEWPGHIEPLPTAPRWERFTPVGDETVSVALRACAAAAGLAPPQRRELFANAFFRGPHRDERRPLFGSGLAALRKKSITTWTPYNDPRVDDELRLWVAEEFRRWDRARLAHAPRIETDEDWIAEREVRPRFTARIRRRSGNVMTDAIGVIARPPASASSPRPPIVAPPLDDALLERVDAELEAFDREMEAILARIARGPSKRDSKDT
jgi:hypothetical protein